MRWYKYKLTRSVNAKNTIREATGPMLLKEKTIISLKILNSNPNPELEFPLNRNLIILKMRFVANELFSELIYILYFEYYFLFHITI